MADVAYPNAPTPIDVNAAWATFGDMGNVAKNCRFLAVIQPIGGLLLNILANSGINQDLVYLTEVAEMPGRGMENIDVRYYGPGQKMPVQSSYDDISLSFVCRAQSFERQFFDDWMSLINPTNTWDFNYKDDYRANIDVYQFPEAPTNGSDVLDAQYRITCHDAYPLNVNAQPLSWMDDNIQRLVVTFTYSYWDRPGIDGAPGTPGPNSLITGRNNVGFNPLQRYSNL